MVLLAFAAFGKVLEYFIATPTPTPTPTATQTSNIVGKTMYVHAGLANLRESASTDAPVVMQLKKGHRLLVFEKQGQWFSVGAHRTRGNTGWIHSSVIGSRNPGGNPIYVED